MTARGCREAAPKLLEVKYCIYNVYEVPEKAERKVAYADKDELERRIVTRYHSDKAVENVPVSGKRMQASMSQEQSNYSLRDSKAHQRQRSQSQEDKV